MSSSNIAVQTYLLKDKYFDSLTKQLNDLRKWEVLVDVILTCDGRKFPAHQLILRAASSYFQTVCPYKDKGKTILQIEIHNMDADTMEIILEFMYTGYLPDKISNQEWSEFSTLLSAANALGVRSLFKHCCQLANGKVDKTNFPAIWELSQRHNDASMLESVLKFVGNNFNDIVSSQEFLSLSSAQLKLLLDSNEDVIPKEVLYDALISWTKHDVDERLQSFDSIIAALKESELTYHHLSSICDDPLLKNSDAVKNKLQSLTIAQEGSTDASPKTAIDPLEDMAPEVQSLLRSIELHRFESNDSGSQTNAIWQSYSMRDGTTRVVQLPFLLAKNAAIARLGEYIYFAGGVDGENRPTARVIRYHPQTKVATFIAPLLMAVWDAAVGTSWGKMYVLGGKFIRDRSVVITDCVQCYDPAACCWSEINVWHVYRSLASAITISGDFYIVGGYEYADGSPCQRIIRYVSSNTQATTIILPEPVDNISHLTAVCLDMIFVVRDKIRKDFLIYDPVTKMWSAQTFPGRPEMIARIWTLCNKEHQLPSVFVLGCSGETFLLHPASSQWTLLRSNYEKVNPDVLATIVFTQGNA